MASWPHRVRAQSVICCVCIPGLGQASRSGVGVRARISACGDDDQAIQLGLPGQPMVVAERPAGEAEMLEVQSGSHTVRIKGDNDPA